jgi:hypothetical protein
MTLRSAVVLAIACLLLCGGSVEGALAQRAPDGSVSYRVPGVEVLPIQGIPFTGKDSITWTRAFEEGGTTTVYEEANIARDGEGRVYRERHRFTPLGVDPRTTMFESSVDDPVNRTKTVCDYLARRCTMTDYQPRYSFALQPVGQFDRGRRYLSRENLGLKTIDDLDTVGTLETVTIAPGTIGNEKQMVTTREFWYSADLKTNVVVVRKDPREGTQDIRLTVYSRSEPDPQIFAVPPGFTVTDARRVTVSGH